MPLRGSTRHISEPAGRRRQRCRYCNQNYLKYEHLVRHERTHTGDRPFECELCGRSFARDDTLARHKRTHRTQPQEDFNELLTLPPGPQALCQNDILPPPGTLVWPQDRSQTFDPSLEAPSFQPMAPVEAGTFEYPVTEFQDISSFGNTEDFLEYIFPLPDDDLIPFSPAQTGFMETADTSTSPANGVVSVSKAGGAMDANSPPALLQLNTMLQENAAKHKQRIRQKGITSQFFDACISLFFSQFNPTFPIVHEPTWKLKRTGPFLLLNIVAIGSLFLGSEDAISKGEVLWEIAQAAASTRWNYSYDLNLRHVAGDYPATQIVETALMGQLYAMLSKTVRLRHMAQSLHGWAFSWARTLGMFDLPACRPEDVPSPNDSLQVKAAAWNRWAHTEMQRRTVLGVFIIDAQLARYSAGVPLGKHVLNSLQCAASEAPFNAQSPDEWITELGKVGPTPPSYRELYLAIFDARPEPPLVQLSLYSMLVVLEGMQALVSETIAASGAALGIPSREDIIRSLFRLRESFLGRLDDTIEMVELQIRWHTLCIDVITDSVQLSRRICSAEQPVFCIGQTSPSLVDEESKTWPQTMHARIALLHALAIKDLAQRLHVGRAHAVTGPAAVFAAATICYGFVRADIHELRVPTQVDLEAAHEFASSSTRMPDSTFSSKGVSLLRSYLQNRQLMTDYKLVSLRQCLYTCQVVLRSMASQWGIAKDMLDLMAPWTSTN